MIDVICTIILVVLVFMKTAAVNLRDASAMTHGLNWNRKMLRYDLLTKGIKDEK